MTCKKEWFPLKRKRSTLSAHASSSCHAKSFDASGVALSTMRNALVALAFLPFIISFSAPTTTIMSSAYDYLNDVPQGPPDAILGIVAAFRACNDDRKVNLSVGAYRDENGKPWVLPCVRQAEVIMKDENKEYLPIEGDAQFVKKALTFAYGSDAPLERIAGVQSLSGTGACRVGGEFLGRFLPKGTRIYIPDPT